MRYVIIDGYTDEPSGLGVPPYLGTYPRYVAGKLLEDKDAHVTYLTIDDLRAHAKGLTKQEARKLREDMISNISIYTITDNDVHQAISEADAIYLIVGVQVPGKYLSARPATLNEMVRLTKDIKKRKVLTGPVVSKYGSQVQGGKKAEQLSDVDLSGYELEPEDTEFSDYARLRNISVRGAAIADQFPQPCIAEIEISQGCWRKMNCSFCTEPLRMDNESFREQEDIVAEMAQLYRHGVRRFRLGRSTCVYSYKRMEPAEIERLFTMIWKACPDIDVLHIDNVRPELVITKNGIEITKLIVRYCTPGNIAAFGCETFDPEVARLNRLNAFPKASMDAVRLLNDLGGERGDNGMPRFLPGINLIFGLMGESKKTHELNIQALKELYDEGCMIRRINIRQVVPFPGTYLHKMAGNKFLRKNNRYYYRWRDDIRQHIDIPMLERVFPKGTILSDVFLEIYDGKTTFSRQFGTYPIVIGIPGRHPLRTFAKVRITGYMKRSLIGEIVE